MVATISDVIPVETKDKGKEKIIPPEKRGEEEGEPQSENDYDKTLREAMRRSLMDIEPNNSNNHEVEASSSVQSSFPIVSLPPELVTLIFNILRLIDLLTTKLVNKFFYHYARIAIKDIWREQAKLEKLATYKDGAPEGYVFMHHRVINYFLNQEPMDVEYSNEDLREILNEYYQTTIFGNNPFWSYAVNHQHVTVLNYILSLLDKYIRENPEIRVAFSEFNPSGRLLFRGSSQLDFQRTNNPFTVAIDTMNELMLRLLLSCNSQYGPCFSSPFSKMLTPDTPVVSYSFLEYAIFLNQESTVRILCPYYLHQDPRQFSSYLKFANQHSANLEIFQFLLNPSPDMNWNKNMQAHYICSDCNLEMFASLNKEGFEFKLEHLQTAVQGNNHKIIEQLLLILPHEAVSSDYFQEILKEAVMKYRSNDTTVKLLLVGLFTSNSSGMFLQIFKEAMNSFNRSIDICRLLLDNCSDVEVVASCIRLAFLTARSKEFINFALDEYQKREFSFSLGDCIIMRNQYLNNKEGVKYDLEFAKIILLLAEQEFKHFPELSKWDRITRNVLEKTVQFFENSRGKGIVYFKTLATGFRGKLNSLVQSPLPELSAASSRNSIFARSLNNSTTSRDPDEANNLTLFTKGPG